MNKRTLAILAVVGTIGVLGIGSAGAVSALSNSSSSSDSIVDRLVEKFNLNKSEVEAVFDEEKAAHQAEASAMQSERLQQLVDDGKITAEQKTKIETKLKELQSTREEERTALEQWAKDNGIDSRYLNAWGLGNTDNRLETAVEDGDITNEQMQLIKDKQSQIEASRKQQRDDLKQWAADNNIDEQYIIMGRMMGDRGHMHGPDEM